jgi:DNA-binding CsgD family transcriptional regulator
MKPEKIKPVDSGSFTAYWLQYKQSSVLPDYKVIFADLIRNVHNFALGMYYWNLGCIPESKIVGAGGALKELTGHSEEKWLGSPPQFSLQHFLPEDVPFVMAYVMKFDQYLQQMDVTERSDARASIYARINTSDGNTKWFCIQYPGSYYDEQGRLVYILAVCSDISHIKKDSNPPFMSILDTRMGEQKIFLCHNPGEEPRSQPGLPNLSNREREIISLLAQGKSSKQISSMLFVSKSTVDNHRQRLLKKLGASSTAEIIHLAVEGGMV